VRIFHTILKAGPRAARTAKPRLLDIPLMRKDCNHVDTLNWFSLTLNLVSTAANTIQLWFSRPTTPRDETAYIRAFRGAYWQIAQYRTAFEAIKHILDAEKVEDRGLELARYIEALSIDDYNRLRRYSQDLRRHIDRLALERDIIKSHYSQGGNTPARYLGNDPWLDAYNQLKEIESQLRQLEHDSQISLGHMTLLVEDVTKVQRAFGTALDIDISIDPALAQKVSDIDPAFEEGVERRLRDREIDLPEHDLARVSPLT
jgi:hypothetical protein